MKITEETQILIVGLGLLGGSYAQALTRAGLKVSAIAHKQEDLDYAMERGFVHAGAAFPDPALIGRADIVIFALYPHVFRAWLEENQRLLKPGALLTDVTGVKRCIVYDIQAMLRPDVEYIAAHPMAGREVYGVRNSTYRMFQIANYIVVPTEKNTPEAIDTCRQLGALMDFARISELTPEEHDEMIAFVSQLTHCIAVTLMTCSDSEHLGLYTGDSFRDLTRIARINEDLWTELFLDNQDALLRQMDLFAAEFSHLRDMLATRDVAGMKAMMRKSTARRIALDHDEGK